MPVLRFPYYVSTSFRSLSGRLGTFLGVLWFRRGGQWLAAHKQPRELLAAHDETVPSSWQRYWDGTLTTTFSCRLHVYYLPSPLPHWWKPDSNDAGGVMYSDATALAAAAAAGVSGGVDSDVEWRLGAAIYAPVSRSACSRHAASGKQSARSMAVECGLALATALAPRWHYRCLTAAGQPTDHGAGLSHTTHRPVQSTGRQRRGGGGIWPQWTCRWPSTVDRRSMGGPVGLGDIRIGVLQCAGNWGGRE